MTHDGPARDASPTRLARWWRAENDPAGALALGLGEAAGSAWKTVTGAHLWASLAGPSESVETCIAEADDVFVEVVKCKEKYRLRP